MPSERQQASLGAIDASGSSGITDSRQNHQDNTDSQPGAGRTMETQQWLLRNFNFRSRRNQDLIDSDNEEGGDDSEGLRPGAYAWSGPEGTGATRRPTLETKAVLRSGAGVQGVPRSSIYSSDSRELSSQKSGLARSVPSLNQMNETSQVEEDDGENDNDDNNIVGPTAVENTHKGKQRIRLVGVVCIVAIIALIVGIVIGTSFTKEGSDNELAPDTSDPITLDPVYIAYREILAARSQNSAPFDITGSPQFRALQWLVKDTGDSSLLEEERLIRRFALTVLYYETVPWSRSLQFLTSANECNWNTTGSGVTCDEEGRILQLSLVSNNLTGTIPPEIVLLSDLQMLDLGDNQLEGTLPDLDALSSLTYLNVSINQLEGPLSIPESWNALQIMDVGNNLFNGSFPETLTNIALLRRLRLGSNELTGSIEDLTGSWQFCEEFDVSDNQLTGSIPSTIHEAIPSVEILSLHRNRFIGDLPTSIGILTNLESLDVSANNFTGSLSEIDFQALTSLKFLSLADNSFADPTFLTITIPELRNLRHLDLGKSGAGEGSEIPSSIGLLNSLEYLHATELGLVGSIPAELGNIPKLTVLRLYGNQLSGTIPIELRKLRFLESLDLQDNNLSGTIPDIFRITTDLKEFIVNDNRLFGNADVVCVNADRIEKIVVDCDSSAEFFVSCSCCVDCDAS